MISFANVSAQIRTSFYRTLSASALTLFGSFATLSPNSAIAANDGWLDALDMSRAEKPRPHVLVELVAEKDALTPQAENRLAVRFTHEDGWHTYWRMPGDAGLPPEFSFELPEGFQATSPNFPLPERTVTSGLTSFGYDGVTLFPFRVEVPRFASGSITVKMHVEYLACRDMCVPESADASIQLPIRISANDTPEALEISNTLRLVPETIGSRSSAHATIEGTRLKIDMPHDTAISQTLDFLPLSQGVIQLSDAPRSAALKGNAETSMRTTSLWLTTTEKFAQKPTATIEGILVADGGPAQGGWAVEAHIPLEAGTVPPPPAVPMPELSDSAATANTFLPVSAWTAILSALFGGLILNLMPCVFPVLSLKLLELIRGAHSPGRLMGHGVAFTGGVLATMLLLSGLLLTLRSAGHALGWGFQLQSPGVVAALMLLFTAITLNLLGIYEFTAGSRIADAKAVRATPKTGLLASFLTGVLAVIVASPCTAPFMGAALGYALTQPALEALLVFMSLGFGMSLPWLLLCLFPAWAKHLPKPGLWMNTFRRIMAIPMALGVIWLGWVLLRQTSYLALLALCCGMTALAVFCWLLGRRQWGLAYSPVLMGVMFFIAVGSAVTVGSNLITPPNTRPEVQVTQGWRPWSEKAVREALASGHPVFVDFTAAWCITCQANRLAVLSRDEVVQRMDALGYVKLEGDWTNRDAGIAHVLAQFGRSGVPLYLIYRPNGTVEALPELLTPGIVLEALERNAK